MSRELKVCENLAIALARGPQFYTDAQRKFILRFFANERGTFYSRPSFFGSTVIDVENLTQSEFNRLHRIANLTWKGKAL